MKVADFDSLMEVLDSPHQYSGYIVAKCSFHDDQRPSLFIYNDYYKCLACGAHGRTSNLLARLGKQRVIPQKRQESAGSSNPFSEWARERTLKQTLKLAWRCVNQNPGMGNYITQDRGIIEPYRKLLGIGYIDDWYTIPIRNRDGIIISAIARKGRDNNSLHKYVLPYGTNPNLLFIPNWSRVRNARYLLLTFGILDAVVLAMLGEPAASTISGKQLQKVALAQFRIPIMLIPDRQEEAEGLVLAHSLGWRGRAAKATWPEGCKDVNDIWVKDRELCKQFVKNVVSQI